MKATRFISDLKNINGRVTVEPEGLLATNMRVQLGESLLTVDAKLSDFTDPQLSLDVRGPSVRAQDLVFYSPTAMLRDIDGRLEINRKGLTFSPVNVRLDGGTDASVRGTIEFKRPYPVNLEVASEHALLSEVIGLWTGRSKEKKEDTGEDRSETQTKGQQTPIMISAEVKKGDLYGMKFKNASGVIKPSRKRLIIHPLDFSVGEGYCNAQVITEFQTG
ncbi:MAG: hypothetical protein GWO23_12160, partial [Gammaproteobacteria bacterium]|nr:hypothetical protein [Gammaproteobacteria bacterium]NIW43828.1 hypothetical protein [Gammaproteobacteria bacterium]